MLNTCELIFVQIVARQNLFLLARIEVNISSNNDNQLLINDLSKKKLLKFFKPMNFLHQFINKFN